MSGGLSVYPARPSYQPTNYRNPYVHPMRFGGSHVTKLQYPSNHSTYQGNSPMLNQLGYFKNSYVTGIGSYLPSSYSPFAQNQGFGTTGSPLKNGFPSNQSGRFPTAYPTNVSAAFHQNRTPTAEPTQGSSGANSSSGHPNPNLFQGAFQENPTAEPTQRSSGVDSSSGHPNPKLFQNATQTLNQLENPTTIPADVSLLTSRSPSLPSPELPKNGDKSSTSTLPTLTGRKHSSRSGSPILSPSSQPSGMGSPWSQSSGMESRERADSYLSGEQGITTNNRAISWPVPEKPPSGLGNLSTQNTPKSSTPQRAFQTLDEITSNLNGRIQMDGNRNMVFQLDDEVVENIVEMPTIHFVDKIVEVPEVHYVDKIVHVPKIEEITRDVFVDKPEIIENIKEVPKIEYQEKIIHVPKLITEERETLVKGPIQYVEKDVFVPKIVPVERVVEVPQVEFREKIVEVPQIEFREKTVHVPKIEQVVRDVFVPGPKEFRVKPVAPKRPPGGGGMKHRVAPIRQQVRTNSVMHPPMHKQVVQPQVNRVQNMVHPIPTQQIRQMVPPQRHIVQPQRVAPQLVAHPQIQAAPHAFAQKPLAPKLPKIKHQVVEALEEVEPHVV